MRTLLAALVLPLLPAAGDTPQAPGVEESAWALLPLPRICKSELRAPQLVRLVEGAHILLPGEFEDLEDRPAEPLLPSDQLVGLLQAEASTRRLGVRFQPSTPPLLVRGTAAEVAQMRALVDELERATTGWEIELRVWVTPGASEAGTHPGRDEFQRAIGNSAPWASARIRSGEQAVLGQRSLHPFTADFSVEVAQDSGVAAARPGRVVVGRTLHLKACRALDGAVLHLEGLLDWSELQGLEEFETGNHELGILEQPIVSAVQLGFSGTIASGGVLAIATAGAPLSMEAWTVWVQASTPKPASGGTWAALDLALLESQARSWPTPAPGGGLEVNNEDGLAGTALDAISSSTVAQAGDMARGDRASRAPILSPRGLVFAPAADAAMWNDMRSLVAAAESVRLREGTLKLALGGLRVTLPVAEGVTARVLVAQERMLLTSYWVEVAQESWMPVPNVERSLDGLLVQGRLLEGEWLGGAWKAKSGAIRVLERPQVNIGRQQSVERDFQAANLRVGGGAPVRALESAGGPALELLLELSGRR